MIAALTITLGWWLIPAFVTALCLFAMFRTGNANSGGMFGNAFDVLFSLFWLIPIGFIWAIYFGLRLWLS